MHSNDGSSQPPSSSKGSQHLRHEKSFQTLSDTKSLAGQSFYDPNLGENEQELEDSWNEIQRGIENGQRYQNRASKIFPSKVQNSDKNLADRLTSILDHLAKNTLQPLQTESQSSNNRNTLRESRLFFTQEREPSTNAASLPHEASAILGISPQHLTDWEKQIDEMQPHSLDRLRAMRAFAGIAMEVSGVGEHNDMIAPDRYDRVAKYLDEHNTRANRKELVLVADRVLHPETREYTFDWKREHSEHPNGEEFEVNFIRKNSQQVFIHPQDAQRIGVAFHTIDISNRNDNPLAKHIREHLQKQTNALDGLSGELAAMLQFLPKEDIDKARCKSAIRHTAILEDPILKEQASHDLKAVGQKARLPYTRAKIEISLGKLIGKDRRNLSSSPARLR